MDEQMFPGYERRVEKEAAKKLIAHVDYKRLICLTGDMNAGKTHTIIESIEECVRCKVALFVVGRISLADEIELRMQGSFDVYNYSKQERFREGILKVKMGVCEVKSVFVVCINSLNDRILPTDGLPFDMVIIDEATMTNKNLLSPIIDTYAASEIMNYAKTYIFPKAEVIVLIDAALPEPLKKDYKNMISDGMDNPEEELAVHNLRLVRPDVKPIFNKALHFSAMWQEVENVPGQNLASMMKEILQAVYVYREKISISMPFKEMAHKIACFIRAAMPETDPYVPHIVVQTADERQERAERVARGYTQETLDFHELCRESEVVIINPCVSVGVSIGCGYIAKHFAFFSLGPYTCSLEEQIQMTARVRNIETSTLYYCVFNPKPNSFANYKDVPQLHNFFTEMKQWSNNSSASYHNAHEAIKRALERAYPNIALGRGLHRKRKARKSTELIKAKMELDAAECDKVYGLTNCEAKWSLVSGKKRRRPVYSRTIPEEELEKSGIKYKKTYNGEYYLVCA
ncbi:putative DEAD-box ATP-dependent RNA helicase [Abalone herpesvirus Victoria/AUS/2009]|uniref:AbHVp032 n=3 Tax=Herpesvirales TaxID=548681 RepID=E0ADJ3_9VIRU|nr:putative DEAD-box ATP-dependent RNA helicase [Abalone herpesvirus Victoria/AUS/2009]ADL16666.1 AbHVp032 [Abalone herpesvirus Victoria/AUS/2007]AEK98553.1 tc_p003 [Abalone herpesvirus Taiwan/2004]AMW36231.1 putative DEAD-box ATP-dependent RNA helicase [Abalone herpesvirus Taiwan/2005]UCX57033.1 ORF42 [Haliotid herpesvirus 1]AFU90056.1 putative DEAD-box ATP-dependent RNA helicase [Abalone herpesvirus Victoria/AUS/2009]